MQAIDYQCYGSPDVIRQIDSIRPVAKDGEIQIKVHAAAVNPYDWHYLRGSPYIMRLLSGIGSPKDNRLGVDFSGTVTALGPGVKNFKIGDGVIGASSGAFAEYLTMNENRGVVKKPENITFQQAASVPIAAITALQALRDKGQLRAGQKVLINGASGGVGTFAVQIAKAMGAQVSGVCSSRNVEMVKSIGADYVIDYKKENYTTAGKQYDLILDMVGNHSLLANRKAMSSSATLVMVGGPKGNWIAPLIGLLKAPLVSLFVEQNFVELLAEISKEDLNYLAELMAEGKVVPVIDRLYPLAEVADAIRYSETGRARGKIIIEIESG
ncbi:MAG: zinc-binding dehydrogenase [Gammaproteobacteria bacterium]|nr:zinc-binding dehydrogenase [Gammaproteobacteria bacterium]